MRMLVSFKKDEIVRHLGLLDLQRTMQRALRRSGLPVAYSNGFNPHIIMNFASALSAGIPGDAEVLDVALSGETTEEACLSAMNRVLPPVLAVSRVRLVDDRFPKASAALRTARYRVTLRGGDARRIADDVPAFLGETEIMALRKSKKQEAMVNIRPMIHELTAAYDEQTDTAVLDARVSFVEQATLKPDLMLTALCAHAQAALPNCQVRRTQLYGEADGRPVPLMDL